MMYRNSQFNENGYKVYGSKVTHHRDAECSDCNEQKEVATIWNSRTKDCEYNDICIECAVKVGYEVVS